jgi:serine protease Do
MSLPTPEFPTTVQPAKPVWASFAAACWLVTASCAAFPGSVLDSSGAIAGQPGAQKDATIPSPEIAPVEEQAVSPSALQPNPARRDDLPWALRKETPNTLDDLLVMERHIEELIERVTPAVVAVRVGGSAGSAVIVSPDGLALCAAHVGGAPDRTVRFTFPDGRTAQGKTLGANHGIDSGLMKITDPGPWPYVEVAEADDTRLGDWVLALGHPGGYDPERAVVVRLGRIIRRAGLLQTDCTVVAGDSGGPLFDMHGRVVGIHSRISDSLSGNFHVPISTYLDTWDRLTNNENWGIQRPPSRSWIGVRVADHPDGCLLEDVEPEGPAFIAGLRPGDVVRRVNGERIEDADSFVSWIRTTRPDNELTVSVRRGEERLTMTVKVAGRRRTAE